MARAQLQFTLTDRNGNIEAGVTVHVYESGTTTPIAAAMHDAITGGNVVTNPLTTDVNGGFNVYLDAAQYVDLGIPATSHSAARTVPSVAVGVGGSATPDFTIWSPDAPPLVAGALDDEFDAATVTWGTLFDPDNTLTASQDGGGSLIFSQQTVVNNTITGILNVAGRYAVIPIGDFTITTLVTCRTIGTTIAEPLGGIALWEDAADASKRLYLLGPAMGDPMGQFLNAFADLEFLKLANYALVDYTDPNFLTACTTSYLPLFSVYQRIRRTGTTYSVDFSLDGKRFVPLYTGTLPYAPKHFGVYINANGKTAGIEVTAEFDFIRYKDSDVGLMGRLDGARIGGFYQ